MYNYNSSHKIIGIILVVLWAIFHFKERSNQTLVYEDGQPIRTGNTQNNLNHGEWIWYNQAGKVQIIGKFDHGKRVGEWKNFDDSGRLILVSNYQNNLLNGALIQYDTNGIVLRKEIYRDDVMINKIK